VSSSSPKCPPSSTLTNYRPQSDRGLQSKCWHDQIVAHGCDKSSQTFESRFHFSVVNGVNAGSRHHSQMEDVVNNAVQQSLQSVSMARSPPSMRSRPSTEALAQEFLKGPNHNISSRAEDIRGIGAWTSTDQPLGGLSRHEYNACPFIDLNDLDSNDTKGTTAHRRTTG